MRAFRLLFWLFLAVWPLDGFSDFNQITDLHVYAQANRCQLVLDAMGPLRYHFFTLSHPRRLVLDIDSTHFVRLVERDSLQKTPIRDIRTGITKNKGLRIVFDVKHTVQ